MMFDKVARRLIRLLGLAMLVYPMHPAASQPKPEGMKTILVIVDGKQVAEATTPEAALRIVRAERQAHPRAAILIRFPPAVYRIAAPLQLGPAESGTGQASLVLRGAPDGGTIIKGSVALPPLSSTVIDPSAVPGLSPPELRYGSYLRQEEDGEAMIFDNGRHIDLSRWPEHSYVSGWQVTSGPGGTLVSHPGFKAPQGVPVLVAGYVTADWAYEAIPGRTVASGILLPGYRPATMPQNRVRLAVTNLDGNGTQERYRFINGRILLSGVAHNDRVEIATSRGLLTVERASNVTIENIAFEHSIGAGVRIYVSSHVTLRNCYVGGVGDHGISVEGGDHATINGCVVADTGLGGITLFGGDRTTLTSSGHVVEGSVIAHTGRRIHSYTPGVALLGTGNRLTHSIIYGLPHAAVGISGNDNRVDGNDIHAVACETGDVGAIYMGHDWTQRGNRIDGNFIHDIGTDDATLGNSAVYLDDQFSGAEIGGNVILRAAQGVVIGGGRDNVIAGNVFAHLRLSAIWLDRRGLEAQKAEAVPGGALYRSLLDSPFRSTLWRDRYPTLATLPNNQPGAPIGNQASGNLLLGTTFLQSLPPGLTLERRGNRQGTLPDLLNKTLDSQFKVLSNLLPSTRMGSPPGPIRPLLHRGRFADLVDCRSFVG